MSIVNLIEVELYTDLYSRSSNSNVDTSHVPELAEKIASVVREEIVTSLTKVVQ